MAERAFTYIVRVTAEDRDKADQVMSERIGFDEDYGFGYTIDFRSAEATDDDGAAAHQTGSN